MSLWANDTQRSPECHRRDENISSISLSADTLPPDKNDFGLRIMKVYWHAIIFYGIALMN